MKKSILLLVSILAINFTKAQDYSDYHPSSTMVNDLVHTKLKVGFDIPNEKLFGEAWITLKPHFYPTDSLTLDAKGMEISVVSLTGNKSLKYSYSGTKLKIALDKTYKRNETYTVYIKYVAIPGSIQQKGSQAIHDAKGLYFINPRGENKEKPTQIWTQGETESNSCWFPTIDKPNQKTSEEIYITVPDKYVTLSNGVLKTQTKNSDGTRTDYWKFDKKHAPYLFFMGIGEFSIVKDKWKNIPVDYYVDKEYEPYAKQIFGDTPSMIEYFSTILQYPYPWEKYSQMVGRDYISGAMENTTCTLHDESALQKPGQLIDKNTWEPVIAHELFHHWFGDLATTESWSNLPVNESFANYSEYLWLEHKYGKDYAEEHRDEERKGYMYGGEDFEKDLIRFQYKDKEDMLDAVSYNKGGLILHMLRNYLGDDAFFSGMSVYLKNNEYKATEAHQLRLAWEEVSGKDLNWFFNQWFFGNGHPKLKVAYNYNELQKTVSITLTQIQNLKFQFPLDIDIYENGKATRHHVWAKATDKNTFELPYKTKPQLVNINPDRVLLCELTDDKTIEQYISQYNYAIEYSSRKEALSKLADAQTSHTGALETLLKAASFDKFEGLRSFAISKLDETNPNVKQKSAPVLEKIATSDSKTLVQANAIKQLGKIDATKYKNLFIKSFNSPSYGVKAACILAILKVDKNAASELVSKIDDKNPGKDLSTAIAKTAIYTKDNSKLGIISKSFLELLISSESQEEADTYIESLKTIMQGNYPTETQNIVDAFVKVYPQAKNYEFGKFMLQIIQVSLQMKQQASITSFPNQSLKDQVKYISDGLDKMK